MRLLQQRLKLMESIAGRDQLVGREAPALTFRWSSGLQTSTLADLKGKVVLIDFWATSCVPCIRAFPKLRALQARYKNFDVVILGVTSVQGRDRHTSDDVEREFARMAQYIEERDITWPIAFTEQDVYNPDYGVDQTGIPHLTLVDPAGRVRFNGMNPGMCAMDDLCDMIDALLTDFDRSVPIDNAIK